MKEKKQEKLTNKEKTSTENKQENKKEETLAEENKKEVKKEKTEKEKDKKISKINKVETNKIVEEVLDKTKELEKEKIKKNKKAEKTEKSKKNKKEKKVRLENTEEDKKMIEELEKVKQEQTIPADIKKQMNDKVFKNIILAILIMIYLLFINMGFINIAQDVLVTDLKVFSITLAVLAIVLFERAYKKDSGELAINGIEVLVLAIATLISIGVLTTATAKFQLVIAAVSFLYGAYYTGKAIFEYVREKKKYLKQTSDIKDIIKK